MALDLTSTQVSVPHPSPDQEDVGPSPVLCLATSDQVFRFFSLGSRERATPPCVAAPRGVPSPPEVQQPVQPSGGQGATRSESDRPLQAPGFVFEKRAGALALTSELRLPA